MMLDLSRCTLLFVETRAHKITKRVIEDCLSKATFGDVLIYTDDPYEFAGLGARILLCDDFPNKKEAGQFYYSAAMAEVETDFALMLEWDAGIHDPSKWRPEFFNYDYIGAPWTVRASDPHDVGNGGFTLMSKRLGHFLCRERAQFPVCTDWDICRNQRTKLEAAGLFKWPKRDIASHFSWELGPRNPENFGFHGAFRWIDMLSQEELTIRAKLMTETPYLRSKMADIFRHNKVEWLEKEIGPEVWASYQRPSIPVPPHHRGGTVVSPGHRQYMLRLLAERQAAARINKGQRA